MKTKEFEYDREPKAIVCLLLLAVWIRQVSE